MSFFKSPIVRDRQYLDSEITGAGCLDAFARFDGFGGWSDMERFWWETHEAAHFRGVHIRWIPLPEGLA